MNSSPPKGTYDVIPENSSMPWRESDKWDYIEEAARECARLFGCKQIRTPIFEHLELFTRSVGESSDIVSKEMYQFEDRSQRKLVLRPEGTACAVRAAIEGRLYETPFTRLYYIGPMFRYERPQAGRFRQHQQLGVELLGSAHPQVDVEAIQMMLMFFERVGIPHLTLNINSLGTKECQKKYSAALKTYLEQHAHALSEDSKRRLITNPLRILDSKDIKDHEVLEKAPVILDLLNEEAAAHFATVKTLLEKLAIPFVINTNLVRGLDYYTHTVFEVTSSALGAQNAIGGGGRYDNLVHELGGPHLPAVGFATGLERVITTALAAQVHMPPTDPVHIVLLPMEESAQEKAFLLASILRRARIRVIIDRKSKKIVDAIHSALKIQAAFFCPLGSHELKSGYVKLKNLSTREEHEISFEDLKSFFVTGAQK